MGFYPGRSPIDANRFALARQAGAREMAAIMARQTGASRLGGGIGGAIGRSEDKRKDELNEFRDPLKEQAREAGGPSGEALYRDLADAKTLAEARAAYDADPGHAMMPDSRRTRMEKASVEGAERRASGAMTDYQEAQVADASERTRMARERDSVNRFFNINRMQAGERAETRDEARYRDAKQFQDETRQLGQEKQNRDDFFRYGDRGLKQLDRQRDAEYKAKLGAAATTNANSLKAYREAQAEYMRSGKGRSGEAHRKLQEAQTKAIKSVMDMVQKQLDNSRPDQREKLLGKLEKLQMYFVASQRNVLPDQLMHDILGDEHVPAHSSDVGAAPAGTSGGGGPFAGIGSK